MAEKRYLSRPPLVEALVDMRVPMLEPFTDEQRQALFSAAEERGFFAPEIQFRVTGSVQFSQTMPVATKASDPETLGYRFTSVDGCSVVQLRRDGFTLNRLRAYRSWERLLEEARGLWAWFVDWARPDAIERLAVRYVNHIPLPAGSVDLGEFLTRPPQIPENLPRTIARFLSSVHLVDVERDVSIHLVQATRDVFDADRTVVVLDLDVFKTVMLSPVDEEIWRIFGILHELKDATFFGSLTERSMELFQ